jgi:hypothetical protein
MKLKETITINPPPYTDAQTNQIVFPQPLSFDSLDVTYHCNPATRIASATIRNIPGSFILAAQDEYTKLGDFNISKLESLLYDKIKDDTAKVLRAKFPKTLEEDPNGPGTILSSMISTIGIKSTPNCSCRRHAIEMNTKGPEWCEQNMSTILGWLKEESSKRHLPYIESVASLIVKRAIKTSKRLLKDQNNA